MNYFLSIFIFCVILFLYLHIIFQLKTSNDLEIYTIDKPSKDKLEEICDIRQPVVFDYFNEDLMNNCSLKELDNKYGAFDLKVKEVGDNKDSMFLPLLMKETLELFKSEDKKYITENNNDFLEETCGIKHFKFNDYFLRPSLLLDVYMILCQGRIKQ